MQGKLGVPYRFFYSSKNYVSGLTNIVAKVKRPDDVTLGVYVLIEVADVDFSGTYYFDIVANQLLPEGEYTVVIKELTSGFRQISKVTMTNQVESSANSSEIDIVGQLLPDNQIIGEIVLDPLIIGTLFDAPIVGIVDDQKTINGVTTDGIILGTISLDDSIIGVLNEEC
jgi:hypothetical protein